MSDTSSPGTPPEPTHARCEKCWGKGFIGGNPYPCDNCFGMGTIALPAAPRRQIAEGLFVEQEFRTEPTDEQEESSGPPTLGKDLEDAAGFLRLTTGRDAKMWTPEAVPMIRALADRLDALRATPAAPTGAAAPTPKTWLETAGAVFPNSRPMTREERAEFDAAAWPELEPVEIQPGDAEHQPTVGYSHVVEGSFRALHDPATKCQRCQRTSSETGRPHILNGTVAGWACHPECPAAIPAARAPARAGTTEPPSSGFSALLTDATNAAFDCGEWVKSDDPDDAEHVESYAEVLSRLNAARAAVNAYVAELESRVSRLSARTGELER